MANRKIKIRKKAGSRKNLYQRTSHSHEPRAHLLRRIFAYSIFALLTLVLTVLIFYRTKGYTFTKNGQVERRGIVLVDSRPVASKIYLDNRNVGETDDKLEITEGDHTIRLEADGYKTWQTSFHIKAEQVKWFYYPYLIPNTLTPQNIQENISVRTYSNLGPEDKIFAYSKTGTGQSERFNLELINLREEDSSKMTTPVLVPSQLFSSQADGTIGELSFAEWSPNGDSIYLEHTFDGKKELINVRLEAPQESTNLSRSISTNITQFHYDDQSRLFLLNGGELAMYNPKTLAKEFVVDIGVSGFRVFKDKYVYTKSSATALQNNLGLYIRNSQNAPKVVTTLRASNPADVDFQYTTNRRTNYLSVTNLANKELLIFKSPLESEENAEPLFLSTFNNLKSNKILENPGGSNWPGSYIALQTSEKTIFIYNFEDESSVSYTKELDMTDIAWIDPEHIQARTKDGTIYYFDFDGNYTNEIANTNQLFSYFVKAKNKTVIINSSLEGKETISQIKFKN